MAVAGTTNILLSEALISMASRLPNSDTTPNMLTYHIVSFWWFKQARMKPLHPRRGLDELCGVAKFSQEILSNLVDTPMLGLLRQLRNDHTVILL